MITSRSSILLTTVRYIAIFDVHEIGWQRRFKRKLINRWESGELHDLTKFEIDQYPRIKHSDKSRDWYRNNNNFHVFRDRQPDDELIAYVSDLDGDYDYESDDDQRTMERTPNGSGIEKGKGYKRKRSSSTSTLQDLSPSQRDVSSSPSQRDVSLSPSQRSVSSRTRKNLKMKANSTTTVPAKTFNGLPHPAKFYEDRVMQHFERCQKETFDHSHRCRCSSCGSMKEYKKMIRTSEEISNIALAATSLSQYAIRALEYGTPLEPSQGNLWVRPLRVVLGRDFHYQYPMDVFAVVQWVDNKIIQETGQARRRNIRIVDSSTRKKVLLRVEVDSLNFTPAVGTIALFRRLFYQKYDGGSLTARSSDCVGHDWFLPNPVNIKGCDVDRLRKWWDKKQVEVGKERKELARIQAVMGSAKLAERCHPECINDTVDYHQHEKLRKLGLALDPPDKERPRWDTADLY